MEGLELFDISGFVFTNGGFWEGMIDKVFFELLMNLAVSGGRLSWGEGRGDKFHMIIVSKQY